MFCFSEVAGRCPVSPNVIWLNLTATGTHRMAKINRDACMIVVKVYLRKDGAVGRIDGPTIEGENGYLAEPRIPPDDAEFSLLGDYVVTGPFVPYCPYAIVHGQSGIDQ